VEQAKKRGEDKTTSIPYFFGKEKVGDTPFVNGDKEKDKMKNKQSQYNSSHHHSANSQESVCVCVASSQVFCRN